MENRTENGNDGDAKVAAAGSNNKFPLSFWEVTVASSVVLGFLLGLLGVYLTMPESDYSFLKLPRSLEDLQILRFFFFSHYLFVIIFLVIMDIRPWLRFNLLKALFFLLIIILF